MVAMKNNKVNRLPIHSSSFQCIDSVRSHFSFNLNSGSKYILREVILVCLSVKLYLRTEEIAKTCEHYTPVSHFFLLLFFVFFVVFFFKGSAKQVICLATCTERPLCHVNPLRLFLFHVHVSIHTYTAVFRPA